MGKENWIAELSELIGADRVITQENELADQSYDQWPVAIKWKSLGKSPYQPQAIVRPSTSRQISLLLSWASGKRIPVTPRGAASGVTGASIAMQGGISLDLTGMDQIIALDEGNLLVKAQAGVIGGELEKELNQRGYTLNHSPQSLHRSTLGGWVATRASGQFSARWGSIEDLVHTFTVALPTGELIEMVSTPRAAMGPDLKHLFIGSEGTLGVIVDVTMKIFPLPERRQLVAVQFASLESGLSAIRLMARNGLRPFLVRLYDPEESKHVLKDADFAGCILFLGFEGIQAVADVEYQVGLDLCTSLGGQIQGSDPVTAWMLRRFDFSAIEEILNRPGGFAETIEVADYWDGITDTYHSLRNRLNPLASSVFGHFSHVYPQGTSLYLIITGQAEDDRAAEQRLNEIWERAMLVCLERGVALSHHHGIGLARLPYIHSGLGANMLVLERLKSALDPAGIMNPQKLGLFR